MRRKGVGTGDGPVVGGEEARGVGADHDREGGADRERCGQVMVLEQVGQGALTGKIWAGLGLLRSRQEDGQGKRMKMSLEQSSKVLSKDAPGWRDGLRGERGCRRVVFGGRGRGE